MPDDAELVKAGTQGIVEGAMKPFSDLIQALFGPAAAEAGLMLKDSVQHYRHLRRIRFLKRTQQVLANARIQPAHVSLKLLIPIIENASNEEEDDLQDIWANLLANAANPDGAKKVYPSFPAILKELTARDVKFLDALFTGALERCVGVNRRVEDVTLHPKTVNSIFSRAGLAISKRGDRSPGFLETMQLDNRNRHLSMDTFERHNVVAKDYDVIKVAGSDDPELGMAYSFTSLGASFVRACRDPKDAA